MAKAKLTISIKRRLGNGDEVFIAPGIEMECAPDALEATQEHVSETVHAWMDSLLAEYPDAEPEEEDDIDEDEDADEDEDEDDDGDEEELSEDDINGMKLAELKALIKDEELDIKPNQKVGPLREAIIEALFDDEDDDDEDDDDEDADDDDDDGEDLTEDDLKEMKLAELQDLCEEWEIGEPKTKKGASLAAKKKAYIAHIMESSEEE